jgi:hypothetical protein
MGSTESTFVTRRSACLTAGVCTVLLVLLPVEGSHPPDVKLAVFESVPSCPRALTLMTTVAEAFVATVPN